MKSITFQQWKLSFFSKRQKEEYSSVLYTNCLYNTTQSSQVDKEQKNPDIGMPLEVNMYHMFCLVSEAKDLS